MMMTDGEITASYRQAKSKKQQIEILSQLNACTKEDILEILKDHVDPKELPRRREKKMTKKETGEATAQVDELNKKIRELTSKNKCLQDQLAKSDELHAMDLEKIDSEKRKLENSLNELKYKAAELINQNDELQAELYECREKLAGNDKQVQTYEQIESLRTTINVLADELAEARKVAKA